MESATDRPIWDEETPDPAQDGWVNFESLLRARWNELADTQRGLEAWLLALLGLLIQHRQDDPNPELLAGLVFDALQAEPLKWDKSWQEEVYPHPQPYYLSPEQDWPFCQQALIWMIADLHGWNWQRFTSVQQYFGLDSPRGSRWYNFRPESVIEAGFAGTQPWREILFGWHCLADLLLTGKSYE